jgi:hypothetical protein
MRLEPGVVPPDSFGRDDGIVAEDLSVQDGCDCLRWHADPVGDVAGIRIRVTAVKGRYLVFVDA